MVTYSPSTKRKDTRKAAITIALCLSLLAAAMQRPAYADPPTSTNVPFLSSLDVVPDAYSTVQRNDNGIRAGVDTGLLESQVYTMWILIWNDAADNPNCDSHEDFCTAGTADCVIDGTGHLIGTDGIGNFSTSLGVRDTSRTSAAATAQPGEIESCLNTSHASPFLYRIHRYRDTNQK
ncbi:MAG TPA: hypothetical protein VE175_00655 [Woeseiaceae bacterium]|jgi:hypothetical protein|nr:hypothetical protein [Woeseiaceae bacterium]